MSTGVPLLASRSRSEHVAQFGPLPDLSSPERRGRLIDEVERAGLRGRGGGWFPTHAKMRAVNESAASRRRLSRGRHPIAIANGMEGEPASSKDVALMAANPHLVLDGLSLAAQSVGASDARIAVHRGSAAEEVLTRALRERDDDPVPIALVLPPARYVASEESALAHWVGDGVATPVFPDRPFQKGVDGRPTLVQNVETLAHLALIGRNGGDWFRERGCTSAPGTTLVTVAGSVVRPSVVEVPVGTAVLDILDQAGGPTQPLLGYLTGGYGGAWVSAGQLDEATWDPESVRSAGGVIGASVLWALGEDTCPLVELDRVTSWMAGESAGQCGPCMFGLPSIAEDVHRLAAGAPGADVVPRLRQRLGLVAGRGGCKHPDGTARLVATALDAFSKEVLRHEQGSCSAPEHVGPRLPVPEHVGPRLPVPETRSLTADTARRDFR